MGQGSSCQEKIFVFYLAVLVAEIDMVNIYYRVETETKTRWYHIVRPSDLYGPRVHGRSGGSLLGIQPLLHLEQLYTLLTLVCTHIGYQLGSPTISSTSPACSTKTCNISFHAFSWKCHPSSPVVNAFDSLYALACISLGKYEEKKAIILEITITAPTSPMRFHALVCRTDQRSAALFARSCQQLELEPYC